MAQRMDFLDYPLDFLNSLARDSHNGKLKLERVIERFSSFVANYTHHAENDERVKILSRDIQRVTTSAVGL